MKNKESFYLSLLVTLSIIFAFFCIILNHLSVFFDFLSVYKGVIYFKSVANYLFAFITILLWVVYRQWQKSNIKEKELEAIVAGINHDTLIVADSSNRIVKVNDSIKKILGYDPQWVLGKTLISIIGAEHDNLLIDSFFADNKKKRFFKEPLQCKRKNGRLIFLEVIIEKIGSGNESVTLLKDITERVKSEKKLKKINKQLRQVARTDMLTGVLNRKGLEEQLTIEHDRGKREGYQTCVILVDIDDFKRINDQIGYAAGDAILKEISKRLLGTVQTTDVLARIVGNEFLVILPGSGLSEAMLLSEKIRLAISSCTFPASKGSLNITASMGVALLPESFYSIEEILTLTRLPLQKSKELGKNRVTRAGGDFYKHGRSPSDRARVTDELIRGECFYPVVQPIFRLKDKQVVGCELFCRCTIEDLETPDLFFGFALENNILTSVDIQCLKSGISTCSRLKKKIECHINIFPSTLLATPARNILQLLRISEINVTICLEMSERKFVGSPEYLRESVQELRKAGVLIAIDDVGFGRSSLETLISLEPDIVKIDRACIGGIADDSVKRRSFARMLKMLNSINVKQIVEGIETKEEITILKEMGIVYGQGFHLGKPKKAE